ncbi:hypothetical protein MTO96_009769 [Rhipicephalus appendiculatus]
MPRSIRTKADMKEMQQQLARDAREPNGLGRAKGRQRQLSLLVKRFLAFKVYQVYRRHAVVQERRRHLRPRAVRTALATLLPRRPD